MTLLCGRWIHLEIRGGPGPELNFAAALWVGQGLGAIHFFASLQTRYEANEKEDLCSSFTAGE